MTSNSSPPPRTYGMANGSMGSTGRRPPHIGTPAHFGSDNNHSFYGEQAADQVPRPSPSSLDYYNRFPSQPPGLLTFAAGAHMGVGTNDVSMDPDGTFPLNAMDTSAFSFNYQERLGRNTEPWHPPGTDGIVGWKTANETVTRPQRYEGYRNQPTGSDVGTTYTHGRPDSGYMTHSIAPSEQLSQHGDDTRSLIDQVEGTRIMEHRTPVTYAPAMTPTMTSQVDTARTLHENPQWSTSPNVQQCDILGCNDSRWMSSSEFKKHKQRHERPFRCQITDCKRKDGFATKNDLGRHMKSVHKQLAESCNERSFICQGDGCIRAKDRKTWPRLDNFKAHCKRKHPNDDVALLVLRSEIDARTREPLQPNVENAFPAPIPASSGVDVPSRSSMNATLTGIQLRTDQSPCNASRMGNELKKTRCDEPYASQPMLRALDHNKILPTKSSKEFQEISDHRMSSFGQLSEGHFEAPASTMRKSQITAASENAGINHARQNSTTSSVQVPINQPIYIDDCLTPPPAPELDRRGELDAEQGLRQLKMDLTSDFVEAKRQDPKLTPQQMGDIAHRRFMDYFTRKRKLYDAGFEAEAEVNAGADARDGGGTSSSPRNNNNCRICGKHVNRPCDLKKHEKRHSRPWGCTEENCTRTFGSKNDWKRHENSQHYQSETWRCHEALSTSKIGICARTFVRADPFRAHLKKDHNIRDEIYIKDQCRQRRVGRNWQDRFWCGFCKKIIKLEGRGLVAWDERFNHIDEVHFKKGCTIDDWYPLDKDRPKGQLREERNRNRTERDEGLEISDEDQLDDDRDYDQHGYGGSAEHAKHSRGAKSSPPAPPPPPPPPLRCISSRPPALDLTNDSLDEVEEHGSTKGQDGGALIAKDADSAKVAIEGSGGKSLSSKAVPATSTAHPSPYPSARDKSTNDSHEASLLARIRAARNAGTRLPISVVQELYATTGRKVKYNWYCCNCTWTSLDPAISYSCDSCNHRPCGTCDAVFVDKRNGKGG